MAQKASKNLKTAEHVAHKGDTHNYKGWLVSDSLIKRSFAVLGHNLLAALMIYGIIFAFILVVAIIVGIVSVFVHV